MIRAMTAPVAALMLIALPGSAHPDARTVAPPGWTCRFVESSKDCNPLGGWHIEYDRVFAERVGRNQIAT